MPTTVIYNETAVMKCLASYNAKLDIFYSWSFNGYKIDFRYNPFYIRVSKIKLYDLLILHKFLEATKTKYNDE